MRSRDVARTPSGDVGEDGIRGNRGQAPTKPGFKSPLAHQPDGYPRSSPTRPTYPPIGGRLNLTSTDP